MRPGGYVGSLHGANVGSLHGWNVVEVPWIPDGQIVLLPERIVAVQNIDELLIAVWFGDARRQIKAHLARLVADVEMRLLEPEYRSPWVG